MDKRFIKELSKRLWALTIAALFIGTIVYPTFAALPNIFATQPTGNVSASLLDTNFTFLEAQGVQALTTTGSSNAYIATPADAWATGYSSYTSRALTIKPNFTNSGAATINVSGLGTVSMYKNVSGVATALIAGDVVSGIPAIIVCDGTNFLLTNPTSTASSSGALILLKTTNAVAQASVTFDSTVITTAYNKYIIEFDGVYTSGGDEILFTISTNNGSTYLATGYSIEGTSQVGAGAVTPFNAASATSMDLTQTTGSPTSASASSSGTIKFSDVAGAQIKLFYTMSGAPSATYAQYLQGLALNSSTLYLNNIKIAPAAGTFTGNFHLYGVSGN